MADEKNWKEHAEMADGCLHMVREALVRFIPMEGCPPMFYEEAIMNLSQFCFWLGSRGENPTGALEQYQAFEKARAKAIAGVTGRKPTLSDLIQRSA
jgi:hypothetical protein